MRVKMFTTVENENLKGSMNELKGLYEPYVEICSPPDEIKDVRVPKIVFLPLGDNKRTSKLLKGLDERLEKCSNESEFFVGVFQVKKIVSFFPLPYLKNDGCHLNYGILLKELNFEVLSHEFQELILSKKYKDAHFKLEFSKNNQHELVLKLIKSDFLSKKWTVENNIYNESLLDF